MQEILNKITAPDDVKNLSAEEMAELAKELRDLIIETVAANGGHLAPSLGVIELTLALYSVFSFPEDTLIWDVGHQAYAHKILTGRRDRFASLRKKDGITGFPNMAESPYDAFGVGHASTSISAALGYVVAKELKGEKGHVIAVIGDGSLTGGEAYEALNHAGELGKHMIVILNDNHMSIDANVGAMNEYLARIRIAPEYQKAKRDLTTLLKSIPHIGDSVYRTAAHIKDGVRATLVEGNFFEDLGFHYIGPINGHDIRLMTRVLRQAAAADEPVLIHICTKKGKGYTPAENAPENYHGIGKFDRETGKCVKKKSAPTYTSVFSESLIQLAEERKDIVAITAAMPSGTGLKPFAKKYPDRCFDTGIAEEHAMTFAAGLAASGLHPVVALYSTFAQRAFDQMIHDVCLQNLPVTLALDRAGLVGEDGPTHHGVFDLSYLRMIPGMTVFVPKDEEELRHMLFTALQMDSPTAVRYPRGAGCGVELTESFHPLPIGKAEKLREGKDIALLAVGTMVGAAQAVAELLEHNGISAAVVNMRFVKPIDESCVLDAVRETNRLVTMEENVLAGGFGAGVLEILADHGVSTSVCRIGLPDAFIEQGTRDEELSSCGLLPTQIAGRIKDFFHLTAATGSHEDGEL